MSWVWFWTPCWYWHGWRTLLPVQRGGDEYGRRTLIFGWTVTGRVIVAISRPGRLYRPEWWQHRDMLTDTVVWASIYPYGGGEQEHGIQLTVASAESRWQALAVVRLPQEAVRGLAELIDASRSLVWHDPRDADDPFWNPQEER